jgi:F0F1-type ATP synthase membrane subunit b/b'
MENILSNLHLDFTAFAWHSANFLALVGILWLLFFRPFARVIEQRQQRIQHSLARADEIDRLDSIADAERAALIAEARREASEIRRRAHEEVQHYVLRSRTGANADADRIREQAQARHASHGEPVASRQPRGTSTRRRRPRVAAAPDARAQSRET